MIIIIIIIIIIKIIITIIIIMIIIITIIIIKITIVKGFISFANTRQYSTIASSSSSLMYILAPFFSDPVGNQLLQKIYP